MLHKYTCPSRTTEAYGGLGKKSHPQGSGAFENYYQASSVAGHTLGSPCGAWRWPHKQSIKCHLDSFWGAIQEGPLVCTPPEFLTGRWIDFQAQSYQATHNRVGAAWAACARAQALLTSISQSPVRRSPSATPPWGPGKHHYFSSSAFTE